MDYTRLKRDELAVEMERLGLPPADSKMSKAVMLERIESFLASNGSVNGSDKPVSPTRRRSPRRQSPTRKSPRRNSPDRQQSRSPERLKAADTAVTVGDEDNSAQTEPQQTAQQRKKKRRNNKKNKVIERRPLVESSRPKVRQSTNILYCLYINACIL
jgi:hypothetical protein